MLSGVVCLFIVNVVRVICKHPYLTYSTNAPTIFFIYVYLCFIVPATLMKMMMVVVLVLVIMITKHFFKDILY